jgi:hypothetical protein
MNTVKTVINRAVLAAGSLPILVSDALAADSNNTKTIGGMFLDMISPLEPMAKETLSWAYNWEVALIPTCAFLALGYVYLKHVFDGGDGGRDKSHAEKAVGEVKMEAIVKGLGVLVVCMIVVYLVYKKLLVVPSA